MQLAFSKIKTTRKGAFRFARVSLPTLFYQPSVVVKSNGGTNSTSLFDKVDEFVPPFDFTFSSEWLQWWCNSIQAVALFVFNTQAKRHWLLHDFTTNWISARCKTSKTRLFRSRHLFADYGASFARFNRIIMQQRNAWLFIKTDLFSRFCVGKQLQFPWESTAILCKKH